MRQKLTCDRNPRMGELFVAQQMIANGDATAAEVREPTEQASQPRVTRAALHRKDAHNQANLDLQKNVPFLPRSHFVNSANRAAGRLSNRDRSLAGRVNRSHLKIPMVACGTNLIVENTLHQVGEFVDGEMQQPVLEMPV